MPDQYDYDVLVIGAGPGGYVAAIRAAQLGLRTACAEGRETLGGTCLNVGCIPSKALLHASEIFEEAAGGHLAKFGIDLQGATLNLDQMHAEKAKAVKELTGGVEFLFKKNKVDWLKGYASFEGAHSVKVGDRTVTAKDIVIATGSSVTPLPGVEIDQSVVVDSTGALALPKVPEHVVVIGGGYIGLEAAAVLVKLGKRVTLLEALDRVLARVAGTALSRFYETEHRAHGVDLRVGISVECIEGVGKVSAVRLADGERIACEAVIVGIGIIPAVAPLKAAGANGENGIDVDDQCRTSLPNVFAIGDCAAHRNRFAEHARLRVESVQNANDQATVVARTITGDEAAYDSIPWFWSNQYDLRLQTVGLSINHDDVIQRGDPANRSFSLVYLREGKVIALDCVNATKDYVQGRGLVLAGASPGRDALATAATLKELLATAVP